MKTGKTLECPICGKSFARGLSDLVRHQNAPTLRHYSSEKRTSVCSIECTLCGLFVSTADHLALHIEQHNTHNNRLKNKNSHENDTTAIDEQPKKRLCIEDRQAFFGLLSLLVNRDQVASSNTVVDERNIDEFLSHDQLDLIKELKSVLEPGECSMKLCSES